MSKNYNDCDIVFDLLPLYLDGKTGAESNAFIKAHLAECEECREVHQLMSVEISEKVLSQNGVGSTQASEKKGRKRKHFTRTTKRLMILVAGLIGYVCLMAGAVAAVFLYLTSG